MESQAGNRKVRNRRDFSRGLARIDGGAIPNAWYFAPMFVVPFELEDPTSLDRKTIELIWALHNTMACVEKGEEGGYIQGIAGLKCINKKQDGGGKPIILPVLGEREGGDHETADFYDNALKEMDIELRIHEAKCVSNDHDENEKTEHYVFLVVKSPISFSLRHAIYNTLQVKKRGNDGTYADERRIVWNKIATHVRQGLLEGRISMDRCNGNHIAYTEKEMSVAHDLISVNWFQVSSVDSFTCLFSFHNALDWVKTRFFSKYPNTEQMELEGFGLLTKGSPTMTPVIISRYNEYDADIDKAMANMNKKKNKKKRGRGNGEGEVMDDSASVASSRSDEDIVTITKTNLFMRIDGQSIIDEFPSCNIAMRVVVAPYIENVISVQQFMGFIRVFPASVTLDILRKTLMFESMNDSSESQERRVFDMVTEDDEDNLTLFESQQIVCGRNNTLDRPMLSNGDASWARHCKNNVMSLASEEEKKYRLEMMLNFLKLGYGLAVTRAMGSDMYVNGRVASYSKFISFNEGLNSKKECFELFKRRSNNVSGDGTLDALMLFMDCAETCNLISWNLKPDNLFMVMQMMVSDIMLTLNYHGSMIGGACNGIGATIVVRDGGGSYRKWFRDNSSGGTSSLIMTSTESGLGQIYTKRNGSGADFGISIYKSLINIGSYYPQFRVNDEVITELKRTTELGLLQETCNMSESINGGDKVRTHSVSETMKRMYSTELSAGNDPQSQACMKAIAWLVPRNTTSLDINIFKTTRENEKTKMRIPVEYVQAIYGYWLVCSNFVGNLSRERYKTLSTVSRSIASAAGALSHNTERKKDVPDTSSIACDFYDAEVLREARPVFLSGMCTAIVSGFMQWTGILGKLPSSPVVEATMAVFYFHLKFSRALLNPDMYDEGERARSLQISKARGVAKSLFAISLQESIESGRTLRGHQDAIERTCMRMTIESICPTIVPWIIADTMEHMFRLDFLVLMQMFCLKFEVPSQGISIEDLILWLDSGNTDHCQVLEEWLARYSPRFIKRSFVNALRRRGNEDLTDIEHCMYISHEATLGCVISDPNADVESSVLGSVAKVLFKQYVHILTQQCQIDERCGGEEIVRAMLASCVNEQIEWPSVFSSEEGKLNNFWLDSVPPDESSGKANNALAPLRVIITEARRALLAIDCRWLLLVSCLSGNSPSQSSRYTAIGQWTRYFYMQCVPDTMTPGPFLYTGLPSPYMHGGFVVPKIMDRGSNSKKLLLRPNLDECMNRNMEIIGTNAPISSGLVEDLGPAAQRYQLASVLAVSERILPTQCVSYSFQSNIWLPVSLNREEGTVEFGSLRVEDDPESEKSSFYLCVNGETEDITAPELVIPDDMDEYMAMSGNRNFLNGRVTKDIRPLCIFFRPGVLVETILEDRDDLDTTQAGVVIGYEHTSALYRILSQGEELNMTPYEVEDSVKRMGTVVFVSLRGLPLETWDPNTMIGTFFFDDSEDENRNCSSQMSMGSRRGALYKKIGRMNSREIDHSRDFIECKLSIPNAISNESGQYSGKIVVTLLRKENTSGRIDTFCAKTLMGSDSKAMSHKNIWIDIDFVQLARPVHGRTFLYYSVQ